MRRPLDDRRIVVTRPGEAGAELALMLTGLGAEVRHLPTFEIVALAAPADLDQALAGAGDLLLTSKKGLEALLALRPEAPRDLLSHCAGEATAAAARATGFAVGAVARKGGLESLVAGLLEAGGLAGRRFLWPASKLADPMATEALVRAGAELRLIPLYEPRQLLVAEALAGVEDFEVFVFASPSALIGLKAAARPEVIDQMRASARALAIGATTAQALKEDGWQRIDVAARPDNEGLLAACLEHYSS